MCVGLSVECVRLAASELSPERVCVSPRIGVACVVRLVSWQPSSGGELHAHMWHVRGQNDIRGSSTDPADRWTQDADSL